MNTNFYTQPKSVILGGGKNYTTDILGNKKFTNFSFANPATETLAKNLTGTNLGDTYKMVNPRSYFNVKSSKREFL